MAAAGGAGFVVRVLDECGETWEETEDIGDAAVLVDAAGTVAASTSDCSLASLPQRASRQPYISLASTRAAAKQLRPRHRGGDTRSCDMSS